MARKSYSGLSSYRLYISYQVQKKVWWWPLWYNLLPQPFDCVEMAKGAAERASRYGTTEVFWESGND